MRRCMAKEDIYPINSKQAIDTSKLQQFEKVIFLDAGADFSFPDNGILKKLNQHAKLENKYEFYEIFKVYEFRVE